MSHLPASEAGPLLGEEKLAYTLSLAASLELLRSSPDTRAALVSCSNPDSTSFQY